LEYTQIFIYCSGYQHEGEIQMKDDHKIDMSLHTIVTRKRADFSYVQKQLPITVTHVL